MNRATDLQKAIIRCGMKDRRLEWSATPEVLIGCGPLVPVRIVSTEGSYQEGRALLDTGCEQSAVREDWLTELGESLGSVVKIQHIVQGTQFCEAYKVRLQFGPSGLFSRDLTVHSLTIDDIAQYDVLIGWDILRQFDFSINFPKSSWMLEPSSSENISSVTRLPVIPISLDAGGETLCGFAQIDTGGGFDVVVDPEIAKHLGVTPSGEFIFHDGTKAPTGLVEVTISSEHDLFRRSITACIWPTGVPKEIYVAVIGRQLMQKAFSEVRFDRGKVEVKYGQ